MGVNLTYTTIIVVSGANGGLLQQILRVIVPLIELS